MTDIIITSLTIGIAIAIVVFAYLFVRLQRYKKQKHQIECGMCGWRGVIADEFDVCPECGYYSWKEIDHE